MGNLEPSVRKRVNVTCNVFQIVLAEMCGLVNADVVRLMKSVTGIDDVNRRLSKK